MQELICSNDKCKKVILHTHPKNPDMFQLNKTPYNPARIPTGFCHFCYTKYDIKDITDVKPKTEPKKVTKPKPAVKPALASK